MPFYRKFIIVLANNIFKLLLFFTISIVAAVFLYTNKAYIPSVLSQNNVYDRVVPALLETNKEQSLTVGGDITLQDPEVQSIIKNAFPSSDLEYSANKIISSAYEWLEQDTANFEFTLDFSENKQKLAAGLSNFAINRLKSLPVCVEIPETVDPFGASCQPPNIDYETEHQKLEYQLLNESGFLEKPIFTEKDILGQEDNVSFEDRYSEVPTIYALATNTPLYIVLVLISLALIVVFASSTRKIGIRKIGRGLVGAGLSLVFFTVLFSFVLPMFTGSLPIFQSNGQGIDGLLNDVAVDFGQDYSLMIIKISTPLILIGSIMILYAQAGRNKKDYKSAKLKSGVVSSNEQKATQKKSTSKKAPIQSSESSDTKPKRKLKNKKYRKIPKKEI